MTVEPMDAIRALRDRGIDSPEALLQYGEPEQLLAVCHRWDARQGVGPGLLVKWIREQQFTDPEQETPAEDRQAARRRRFAEHAREFPVGHAVESHRALVRRRWLEDLDRVDCPGQMIVFDVTYPLISMACDKCRFEAAIGPRALHLLLPREAPF